MLIQYVLQVHIQDLLLSMGNSTRVTSRVNHNHDRVITWKCFPHNWLFFRGNILITDGFLSHMASIRVLQYISVVGLNKLLNKQSICQWFEMPRHSCDVTIMPGFYTKGRPLVKSNLIRPSDKLSWQPGCPVLNINMQGNFCISLENDSSDNLLENLV